jgi:hypothetical protein
MMEAASTSETSVNFNRNTRRNNPVSILAAVRTSKLTKLIPDFLQPGASVRDSALRLCKQRESSSSPTFPLLFL